ncbi:MAG: alpha-2-macroglobulin family protein [Candidatus Eisenbacteria bacterium]
MKVILKLAVVTVLTTISFHGICGAAEMKDADKLFEDGAFEQALKLYESVYEETRVTETREKAFFRVCESLAHLFRYGEAAERLLEREAPTEPVHQARFLILKSEMLRNFQDQYSYIQRDDVIEDEDGDVFRLTRGELLDEVRKAYAGLWDLRSRLIKMYTLREGYFLDIENIDNHMYPTLLDYLVFAWTDYLLTEEDAYASGEEIKPRAEMLLVEDFDREVDLNDAPALLAAELMEEATRMGGRGRPEARERWKIRRLLLPLRFPHLFDLADLAFDETVYDHEDLRVYRQETKQILLGWMDDFRSDEAKAEAGYEAAQILNGEGKLVEAVNLAKEIERKFGGTDAGRRAEALRSRIEMPTLSLTVKTVMPPAKGAFTVMAKNLKQVHFRLYRLDPDDVKREYMAYRSEDYGKSYEKFDGWADLLGGNWMRYDWGKKWLKSYLSERTPEATWSLKTGDRGDYQPLTLEESPPPLETGICLVCACGDESFEIGGALLCTSFLNVTNLVLIGSAGVTAKSLDAYYQVIDDDGPAEIDDDVFRFYAVDARTGRPAPEAHIDVWPHPASLSTDDVGFAALPLAIRVGPGSHNRYGVDPLARFDNSFSYWGYDQGFGYYPPNPLILFLETDRPIYQPGHTVNAKVVVVRKWAEGFRSLAGGHDIVFSARDTNGKEFFTESVTLGEYGSAAVEFEIPHGRLLGRYSLRARCSDGRFTNEISTGFSVEEYKRPEFEIELKPAEEPWRYDQEVEIRGEVKYYFGGPVPDAPVTYRIKRRSYIPYFFRYWFGENFSSGDNEIATGEVKTDSDGDFVITFTPTPQPNQYSGHIPDISQFVVEVDARDSGGRTIEAQESYTAARVPIFLVIEPDKGFFLEKEPIEITTKRLTINDTPAPGGSTYEVYILADTTETPAGDTGYQPYRGSWHWQPPLDVQLKDVPNGDLVAEGSVDHDEEGMGPIRLESLPQGTYRIVQKSTADWGDEVSQARIFVVARDTETAVPVNAATVTLVEKDEYKTGEVARFIIGSGLGSGMYHVEIWGGEHLLSRHFIDGDQPVRLIEIPVTGPMKGGFGLKWFGVKHLALRYGQTTVSVPWSEKRLEVALEPFDDELKPGEEYTWGVKLRDAAGKPAGGEVLALMYDRSLEYYVTGRSRWLDALYTLRTSRLSCQSSVFDPSVYCFPITQGLLAKVLGAFRRPPAEPSPPGLRTARTWVVRGSYGKGAEYMRGGRAEAMDEVIALDAAISAPVGMMAEAEAPSMEAGLMLKDAAAEVKTREKLADTAFFKPHIVTTATTGRGRFTFTAPEQLTSWKIKVFAMTKDAEEGTLTEETVTRKDLMVRADLPRFFREKDKGTITAIVHNESERTLQGELFVEVTENGSKINRKINLTDAKKRFDIEPHSLESFNWLIDIPHGVTAYKVRVAAVTDDLSDAEERELPILPSRQRLIESAFITLSGSETKTLEISLKDDPTRVNESMVLQIDPQLALSIINTIPFLIECPYGCVEQILNRYVPLSIVNEVYSKYPAIRDALDKIPDRKTLSPAWEKDDPRRLMTLMETPWVWQSEGRPVPWPVIDMLDPEIVKRHKETNLSRLRSAQLANGAFPWWPGGEADPYMTLYVLSGLAEARRYGVDVPGDMIEMALRYVNRTIPLMLEPEERQLSLVAFAAYVVTSYSPEEFSGAVEGHKAAASWVVFLDRYIYAMTPFGKAYLAYTHLRLGNKARAGELLDMAMDGAREDPVAGVYWAPEKYSWVWYSDTVEKHAFMLRTLQELRPEDERIPGMVRWLLFSRKGTVWKSTKASVAAVYALLDHLNQRGALASDETFIARWGEKTHSVVVKADDWLDEPIRWQETGFEVTPEMSSATVEKEGPGIAFASLTWTYSTDELPEASQPGMLELGRKFYRRVKEGDAYHLKPIESGGEVAVGDEVEVQLKINTRSQFEYMHLKDLKAAGFEAETLLSGWKHDALGFYEEPRHSLTNFFISWLPHGEYILRYRLRPTKPGVYRIGAATLQSMYSPEMTAHSAGFVIKVVE